MGEDVGVKIELACVRERFCCHPLQFNQSDMVILNEENNIIEVGIEAAIQFTEGNAVRVGNEDFQIAKLPNADGPLRASLWLYALQLQAPEPNLRGVLVRAKPVDACTAQYLVTLRKQCKVFVRVGCDLRSQFA
jgi:hypothetical protein